MRRVVGDLILDTCHLILYTLYLVEDAPRVLHVDDLLYTSYVVRYALYLVEDAPRVLHVV